MLPPKIRIIGRDIPILWVSEEEMPKAWGEYDYEKQVVRVRTEQQLAFEADTVLHEFIHAIDDAMQLGMTERQVHCSATGIIALLKDNPNFYEYLGHAIKST